MNGPDRPTSHEATVWKTEAKTSRNAPEVTDSLSDLLSTAGLLDDYDLASVKNTAPACVGYAPVLTAMSHLTA